MTEGTKTISRIPLGHQCKSCNPLGLKWQRFLVFSEVSGKYKNNDIECYSTLKTGNYGQKADKRVNTVTSFKQLFSLHEVAEHSF